ncbi:hypothetical protein UFOVP116_29 [uncultured Caudovirales phage]|uniref:Uncharacterized protein n=1 Tax=uncultured Caudovirales phage TaxID=2100421 RepID=A0A6J5L8E4_9CAUD|nr:hypothetical protein UFOVP116_29 [uncultured Caudovirales phage]
MAWNFQAFSRTKYNMFDVNSLVGGAFDSVTGITNKASDMIGGAVESSGLGGVAFDILDKADSALSNLVGGDGEAGSALGKLLVGGLAAGAASKALSGGLSGILGDVGKSLGGALGQAATADTLRDYQHASKTFVANNLARSPKMGSLFHVFFDVNPTIAAKIKLTKSLITDTGVMVKSVSLPNFNIETKTVNAYNRPNIIQTKIKYDPVTIVFHDDMANMVRDFWLGYYAYYFGDASQKASVYNAPHKYNIRQSASWGYNSTVTAPLINSIKIYQLHGKKFSLITLINPVIKGWQHGNMVSGTNDTVDHTMSIEFESVTYAQGKVSSNNVSGFATPAHYDKTASPISAKGGGTRSIAGEGGLMDQADNILQSFAEGNFGEAALGALRAGKTFSGADFAAMAQTELKAPITKMITDTISGGFGKFSFPGSKAAESNAAGANPAGAVINMDDFDR